MSHGVMHAVSKADLKYLQWVTNELRAHAERIRNPRHIGDELVSIATHIDALVLRATNLEVDVERDVAQANAEKKPA